MGTVHGSIPFYYDEVSDDTLHDDLMEILRQEWVKDAVNNTKDSDEQGQYTTSD